MNNITALNIRVIVLHGPGGETFLTRLLYKQEFLMPQAQIRS